MSKRYFGTDGIRGKVGIEPITADFMLKLGWAAGQVLATQREFTGVLIGKDTRISGYMFESALEAGLVAAGVDIKLLGPMPTPAIAYLTRTFRAHAGIVISASHNPYEDNGIKFFSSEGTKLPDAVETEIETVLKRPMVTNHSQQLGKAGRIVDAAGRYTEFCKSSVPVGMSLDGLHIVVDCAHGATYHIAPTVFRELGAKVSTIGVEPDGLNINAECGSTSPQALRAAVNATGADLGIAFDGDGDRVLFADRQGTLIDGDELLYVIARARQQAGMLKGPVVGTLMSNLGLERALKALNIPLLRAAVGDRYVMEELRRSGGILGGENSGHIICLDRTTTGDGIIAALQVLQVISESGQPIEQLIAPITKHPQHMINLACSDAQAALGSSRVQQAVTDLEAEMGERGRVLLRPSGTEPLVRVMVEGEDEQEVRRQCEQLAAAVTDALGCDDSGSSAAAQD